MPFYRMGKYAVNKSDTGTDHHTDEQVNIRKQQQVRNTKRISCLIIFSMLKDFDKLGYPKHFTEESKPRYRTDVIMYAGMCLFIYKFST